MTKVYRTNRDLTIKIQPGSMVWTFEVPKGTRCTPIPGSEYLWVPGVGQKAREQPSYWVEDSKYFSTLSEFQRHDATHYGLWVNPEDVEEMC